MPECVEDTYEHEREPEFYVPERDVYLLWHDVQVVVQHEKVEDGAKRGQHERDDEKRVPDLAVQRDSQVLALARQEQGNEIDCDKRDCDERCVVGCHGSNWP